MSVPRGDGVLLDGVRALLVEDDAATRDLYDFILSSHGARVTAVESQDEALELFNRQTFDVVASDTGRPGHDGWSFIESIRRLTPEHGGCVPAIAVSARAYPGDVARSLASGYQMHLSKPVEPDDLVAALARLVGSGL